MIADLIAPLQPGSDYFETRRPRVISIYRYWDTQRADRLMPRRADIDPADMVEHLPGILLIDVEGEDENGLGIFRYRVVGTREVANRRKDPTGKIVQDGYFAESADAALRSYESVRAHRAPVFEVISFVSNDGVRIEEDSIMLPLSENGIEVSQILVYSEGQDARGPAPLHPYHSDGTPDINPDVSIEDIEKEAGESK